MKNDPDDKARHKRTCLQLNRLERLTDVVYAINIWRAFMLLPKPTAEEWGGEALGARSWPSRSRQ